MHYKSSPFEALAQPLSVVAAVLSKTNEILEDEDG